MKILVVDVGGTKIKALATGQSQPRKTFSGKGMTPEKMVEAVRGLAEGWEFEGVSLGLPALVGDHGPRSEPGNLGPGWVGFDFAAAFGTPVRIINDAAMQALGSYDGGRMLFLGLGTGLGATLIAEKVLVPLELGCLIYSRKRNLGDVLGRRGLARLGPAAWRRAVARVASSLAEAFVVDYVVLGGGNAKRLDPAELPHNVRFGHNRAAFRGGFRLWGLEDVATLREGGHVDGEVSQPVDWRLI